MNFQHLYICIKSSEWKMLIDFWNTVYRYMLVWLIHFVNLKFVGSLVSNHYLRPIIRTIIYTTALAERFACCKTYEKIQTIMCIQYGFTPEDLEDRISAAKLDKLSFKKWKLVYRRFPQVKWIDYDVRINIHEMRQWYHVMTSQL